MKGTSIMTLLSDPDGPTCLILSMICSLFLLTPRGQKSVFADSCFYNNKHLIMVIIITIMIINTNVDLVVSKCGILQ